MPDTGYLPKEKLKDFIRELAKDAIVHVPCLEGETVVFRPFSEDRELCLERPANIPPKSIIYPQSETLFSFEHKKDPEDHQKMSVELKVDIDAPGTVIFGARPCDARGFVIYDRVFIDTDTPDPYYKKRRENTLVVTLSCTAPFPGCFCVGVGGSPAGKEGTDAMLTEIAGGYIVEPVTEKGKAILNKPMVEDGSTRLKDAQQAQQKAHEAVKNPFAGGMPNISPELFDADPFWEQALSKCVSCGACTYLCPTCYCFNITDEQVYGKGERIRSWDACMFFHFTLEASTHNPRPTKFQRFKNRVGHKFVYYPEKYEGAIACCGCGRCIRYCPVSVDISEIVNDLGGGGKKEQQPAGSAKND